MRAMIDEHEKHPGIQINENQDPDIMEAAFNNQRKSRKIIGYGRFI